MHRDRLCREAWSAWRFAFTVHGPRFIPWLVATGHEMGCDQIAKDGADVHRARAIPLWNYGGNLRLIVLPLLKNPGTVGSFLRAIGQGVGCGYGPPVTIRGSGSHSPRGRKMADVVVTEHPHILRIDAVCGGEPVIDGLRVTVRHVATLHRRGETILKSPRAWAYPRPRFSTR